MKLIGELKEKVDKTGSMEEARNVIKEAGMELTDEELNQVTGESPIHISGGGKDKANQ